MRYAVGMLRLCVAAYATIHRGGSHADMLVCAYTGVHGMQRNLRLQMCAQAVIIMSAVQSDTLEACCWAYC